MEYLVKIDAFEGPLDLLLYLIRDMKISIDDISMTEITDQYIAYIHQMEQLNLEVASEYLAMAAHLLHIKSKMMLPRSENPHQTESYEEDPEEKFKQRMKIYAAFKDIVPVFHELSDERAKHLTKIPTDLSHLIKFEPKEMIQTTSDVYDLLSAFNRVLRRFQLHRPLSTRIEHQGYTIEQRIDDLRLYLPMNRRMTFRELAKQSPNREYEVVTFIAILELAKENFVAVTQDHLFDEIYVDYIGKGNDLYE